MEPAFLPSKARWKVERSRPAAGWWLACPALGKDVHSSSIFGGLGPGAVLGHPSAHVCLCPSITQARPWTGLRGAGSL